MFVWLETWHICSLTLFFLLVLWFFQQSLKLSNAPRTRSVMKLLGGSFIYRYPRDADVGTTENPPTGTDPTVVYCLLPPVLSLLSCALRSDEPHCANLSPFPLSANWELEVKHRLCHFHTVSPNFQWEQTTGASLLHFFNPEPQSCTIAHLARCARCSLDIYASHCFGSCN